MHNAERLETISKPTTENEFKHLYSRALFSSEHRKYHCVSGASRDICTKSVGIDGNMGRFTAARLLLPPFIDPEDVGEITSKSKCDIS